MRKIVQIKTIDAIEENSNSDFLETAIIGGWSSVVKKGEYNAGDKVLYFEIDTALPVGVPEWGFLTDKSTREINSPDGSVVSAHVLQTVKFRGQLSQGLILPIGFGLTADSTQDEVDETFAKLGVFKYEPPIPTDSGAIAPFPSFISKTASERIQNVDVETLMSYDPEEWIATEKIDGTSATFWKIDGKLHAAGRNWELEVGNGNLHSRIIEKYNLDSIVPEGVYIQGEIFGEGIQGNPLKISDIQFKVFKYDFYTGEDSDSDVDFLDWVFLNMAPTLPLVLPKSAEEALAQVEGMRSTLNPEVLAEGVVWHQKRNRVRFDRQAESSIKVISNAFLLKHGK